MDTYKILEPEPCNGVCLECGSVFYGGRTDRKFCSEVCKNRHNNKKTRTLRNLKLRIKTILEKNHDILSGLVRKNISSMGREELRLMGFNPDFVTTHNRANRKDICCCYDISYTITPTRIVNIHKVHIADDIVGNVKK